MTECLEGYFSVDSGVTAEQSHVATPPRTKAWQSNDTTEYPCSYHKIMEPISDGHTNLTCEQALKQRFQSQAQFLPNSAGSCAWSMFLYTIL